jgi:hypothetical protein
VERGAAEPGEEIIFSAPYRARPLVLCTVGLRVAPADLRPDRIRFSGTAGGTYEVVGE